MRRMQAGEVAIILAAVIGAACARKRQPEARSAAPPVTLLSTVPRGCVYDTLEMRRVLLSRGEQERVQQGLTPISLSPTSQWQASGSVRSWTPVKGFLNRAQELNASAVLLWIGPWQVPALDTSWLLTGPWSLNAVYARYESPSCSAITGR